MRQTPGRAGASLASRIHKQKDPLLRSRRTPMPAQPRRRSRATAGLALATLAPTLAAGLTLGVATAPAANAFHDCTSVGLQVTCTFDFDGGRQAWTVPAGVREATFTVIGAWGEGVHRADGGAPGGTRATITTSPGHELQLYVGGAGGVLGGGWNGGAQGTFDSGDGGGASDVRVAPYGLADRVVVAGGGGGGGAGLRSGDQPGAGGSGGGPGQSGYQGLNVAGTPGAGGGGGGTLTAGGFAGGAQGGLRPGYCTYPAAGAGSLGFGGIGGGAKCEGSAGFLGGGGGGGWYGGGGGGGGTNGGAGGGGGSGYGPAGSTSVKPGSSPDNGHITITYVDLSSGWVDLSGGAQTLASAPTAVARPAGPWQPEPMQDVFYLDNNNQVIQRVITNGVPSPQYSLGAFLYPRSTVAAVWRTGGRLDLFGRGTENALWQKSYSAQTGWGPWIARTPAGALTSSPTVVSPAVGRMDVFFRGADNLLMQATSTLGTWAAPKPLVGGGPAADTAPTAVVTNPDQGSVNLFAGCGGALCLWRYDNANGGVFFWGRIPGASVTADPSAASLGPGSVQVSVRDNSGNLVLWQRNTAGFYPTNLGPVASPAGSSIGLSPMSASTSVLYARSTQGTLIGRAIAP